MLPRRSGDPSLTKRLPFSFLFLMVRPLTLLVLLFDRAVAPYYRFPSHPPHSSAFPLR
jgi:hypothetical protein